MENKKRMDYIDFCKVFAMFMVTMAHCAQCLSGEQFPSLLVSKDSFISVNMAIFMIASGFVMNIDKMRSTKIGAYVLSKTFRLLIPMTTWYLICSFITKHFSLSQYWSFYWYLSALFLCLLTVKLLAYINSNTNGLFLLSVLFLSLIPLIEFERSCYMIPFLWVGYALRSFIDRIGIPCLIFLIIFYSILYYFWDVSYSIYLSPFHIWEVNVQSLFAFLYRFSIGTVGGVAFISFIRILMVNKNLIWMKYISQYGSYTLVFYTMSFILNAILARIIWHFNFNITTPGLLDLLSFVISLLMMVLMYYFQIVVAKNKFMSAIFLGK